MYFQGGRRVAHLSGFLKGCLAVCAGAACLLLPPAGFAQQPTMPPQTQQQNAPARDAHAAEEHAAQRQALGFLQALDQGRYAEAYAYTSALIRSKLNREQFVQEIEKDRAPAGALKSRTLMNASYATTLPGVSPGKYVVLQYDSVFAVKENAVETITLSYESSYWRVAGWYMK